MTKQTGLAQAAGPTRGDEEFRAGAVPDDAARHTPGPGVLPAAGLAPYAILSLRLLADLRSWSAQYGPDLADEPLESMAMSVAAIAAWSDSESLRLPARFAVWTYAVDDLVDIRASSLAEVDDIVDRCISIVSGGSRSDLDRDRDPVLTALSDLLAELSRKPLYRRMEPLWVERFSSSMRGMRYAWLLGHGQATPSFEEYLEHADSILKWITMTSMWICTCGRELLENLDVLVPAAEDLVVVIRLANDLATSAREKHEATGNATTLATADQILAEIARRRASILELLAPTIARGHPAALIVARSLDWAETFYKVADIKFPAGEEHRRP